MISFVKKISRHLIGPLLAVLASAPSIAAENEKTGDVAKFKTLARAYDWVETARRPQSPKYCRALLSDLRAGTGLTLISPEFTTEGANDARLAPLQRCRDVNREWSMEEEDALILGVGFFGDRKFSWFQFEPGEFDAKRYIDILYAEYTEE